MDFEPCFEVYNLVSIQFIDWLQFETRPSSSLNFGMAYSVVLDQECFSRALLLLWQPFASPM